jgi:hypothetical protein
MLDSDNLTRTEVTDRFSVVSRLDAMDLNPTIDPALKNRIWPVTGFTSSRLEWPA